MKIWLYFVVTFAWTWACWGGAILTGSFALSFLGVLGPAVAGISSVYLMLNKEGRRDYWVRIVDFRRIPLKWIWVIFLLPFILNVLASGGDIIWGRIPLFALLFVFVIPLIEELGWRGYVLDRLQARYTPLISSLILGVLWSLWHLPLFFIPGTYQSGLGVGTLAFWTFMVGIVPLTFVFTWIYNHTSRSTLAAILFHALVNFFGWLIVPTGRADLYRFLLWILAAFGITFTWRHESAR